MYVRSMQQNLKEFSFRQPVTPAIEFNSRIPQLPYDPSCPSVGRSVVWLTCLPQFRPHPQKGKYWEVTLPQLNARVTAHSVTSRCKSTDSGHPSRDSPIRSAGDRSGSGPTRPGPPSRPRPHAPGPRPQRSSPCRQGY